jgi:hypothetical protein
MHVSENGAANTGLVLVTRDGNSEEAAGRGIGTPRLQELKDLTLALDEVKRGESGAGKMTGSEYDGSMSFAVVTTFWDEGIDCSRLYRVECSFREVTVWKYISDGFDVDGVEEGSRVLWIESAGRDLE